MRAFALLLAAVALTPTRAPAARADARQSVLDAMTAELERSQKRLKLDDHDPPYFIGFRIVDRRSAQVVARFGATVKDEEDHQRRIAVDVRVGDYRFDSHPDPSDFDFDEPSAFRPSADAPLDDNPAVLRATLWLLTDEAYKGALSTYLRKRAKQVTEVPEKPVDSFSKEPVATHQDPPLTLAADREKWAALARRLSDRFRTDGGILDGTVRISGDHDRVYMVNSEGTRIIREQRLYSVSISAIARAPDGMLLDQGKTLYGRSWAEIPDEKALLAEVTQAIESLTALAAAPVADPYTGPAILEPEATGVFFHEAVGHRLEGERQKDENEGRTFKGQVGVRILPEFLSVRDNPSMRDYNGISLNGFYPFDDEGVASQDVLLVQDGVLRAFLTSRTPVEGAPHSNGHGRAQGTQRPMARMGNLIIESKNAVSHDELKQMLVAEAQKQGKPYGLIIRDITGGSTNTSTYGYQAFKGSPRMVYRVDAQTGAEQLVRGVEMVGTPLTAVNKIAATSTEVGVFNGYCGAESGYVPVSTAAPAALFLEIELQRTKRDKERNPVLPPPWVTSDGTP